MQESPTTEGTQAFFQHEARLVKQREQFLAGLSPKELAEHKSREAKRHEAIEKELRAAGVKIVNPSGFTGISSEPPPAF
jgi:hypothetical protein